MLSYSKRSKITEDLCWFDAKSSNSDDNGHNDKHLTEQFVFGQNHNNKLTFAIIFWKDQKSWKHDDNYVNERYVLRAKS